MTMIPFGEWMPDQPDFGNPGSSTITNVVPRTESSYGPMATPTVYSGALNARCQGSYSVRDFAGNVYVFAGTGSKLYLMTAGSTSFSDISKGGGYSTGAVPDGFWSMTSFGERVVFTNYVDNVQTFLAGTDSVCSDLSSGAPKAKYCAVIKDFLMLGNVVDSVQGTQPQRLHWSAIGDPASFPTIGTSAAIQVQSDNQDLMQTDLGQVTGLIGGLLSAADGAAFCEKGVYSINYAGSPDIFSFRVAQGAAGTSSPLSIVQRRLRTVGVESTAFYLGEDGFYAFDGANSLPIGAQKIDKTFFNDLDASFVGYVQGVADPINKLIFWAYMGAGSGGLFNRLLVFNWDLARWALCDLTAIPGEWFTRTTTIGYTLEQLDMINSNLDALPFSLDSRSYTGGTPILSVFDSSHRLNYTTGSNMAPTVETSESQLFPGRRARIINARPIVDGTPSSVSVGHREQQANSVTYEAAVPVNIIGECPQRVTGRYNRFRFTLPAATTFTHLQGVDVNARPEAARR